jgi:hypothetical protein
MSKSYVRVLCDVYCEWEGLPPIYRVYVNEELFAERTWNFSPDNYLEEMLQLDAEPGKYQVRYELVPPHLAELTVKNMRIDHGPANVKGSYVRITE